MSEFTIDDFLVVYPVYAIINDIEWNGRLGSVTALAAMRVGNTKSKAIMLFTDYDLAYDFMWEHFPDIPQSKIAPCEDADDLVTLLNAVSDGLDYVVFDPQVSSKRMTKYYSTESVVEAALGEEEDEEEWEIES